MHPAQEQLLAFFEYTHLPEARMRTVGAACAELAHQMAGLLDESSRGAEVTAGLRKLLEAKDCFVRAALPT